MSDTPSFDKRLHQILCESYGLPSLEQLVQFGLNQRLDLIVTLPAPFATVVFDLIEWARSKGRMRDLVRAAAQDRPRRQDLEELRQEFEASCERNLPNAPAPSSQPPVVWGLEQLPPARIEPIRRSKAGEDNELTRLDRCWEGKSVHVVTIVSQAHLGGVGKSYLVRYWADRMKESYKDVRRILAYSFASQAQPRGGEEGRAPLQGNEQETSPDEFIRWALSKLGDLVPDQGGPRGQAERLANRIREVPTLTILDGIEPLLYPLGDKLAGGKFKPKAEALRILVRDLARDNSGLCVITSRWRLTELSDSEDEQAGSTVLRMELGFLSPEAGAKLLRDYHLKGTEEELQQASKDCGGHALTLALLAKYLLKKHEGDIQQRPQPSQLEEMIVSPQAERGEFKAQQFEEIMQSWDALHQDKPEGQLLRVVSLFNRPAEVEHIKAVCKKTIPHLNDLLGENTNWEMLIEKVEETELLTWIKPEKEVTSSGALVAHPLIREYIVRTFRSQRPNAWVAGHNALFEYFQKKAATHKPTSFDEMVFLYRAVAHGCLAGLHEDAFHVYWERIAQEDAFFGLYMLGAFGEELAALAGFFTKFWAEPVADLKPWSRGMILGIVGFCLRATGHLKESLYPMEQSRAILCEQRDLPHAAMIGGLLSETYWVLGNLEKGLIEAKASVELAEQSKILPILIRNLSGVGMIQHRQGKFADAETSFRAAENLKGGRLDSIPGARYCDLLLSRDEYSEVIERTEKAIQDEHQLLPLARNRLCLAQARMKNEDYARAKQTLDKALEELQAASFMEDVPWGLMIRAELFRRQKSHYAEAYEDLNKALSLAKQSGSKLDEADCQLGLVALYLARHEQVPSDSLLDGAQQSLTAASAIITKTKYDLRKTECDILQDAINQQRGPKTPA